MLQGIFQLSRSRSLASTRREASEHLKIIIVINITVIIIIIIIIVISIVIIRIMMARRQYW